MHEFGHAFGLVDLYRLDGDYPGYLMDRPPQNGYYDSIPGKDIAHVEGVYHNHTAVPLPSGE